MCDAKRFENLAEHYVKAGQPILALQGLKVKQEKTRLTANIKRIMS